MTDLNDITVHARQPMFMPPFLKDGLKSMHLDANVIELYGPNIFKGEYAVYGYFVPDINCILAPDGLLNDEVDLDELETKLGGFQEAIRYITSFTEIVDENIKSFCHLSEQGWNAIIRQESEESDESYISKIYAFALTTDWMTLTKYLRRRDGENLSWEDIVKIFQLEKFDLVQDGKSLIETEKFIIYLHLPQYEKDKSKVIFNHYYNDPKFEIQSIILLTEAEKNKYSYYSGPSALSLEECSLHLYSKPIIKFDGDYHRKDTLPNLAFEYTFDGVFKVIGSDNSGNFILDRIL